MVTTEIREDAAIAYAEARGFNVEIHPQQGNVWDVRIYGIASRAYNRRKDVSKADIGDRIMKLLAETKA